MPRKALSGRSRSHGGSASSPDGGRFGGGSPYRRAAHRGRRGGGVVHKAAQSTGLALDPGDRTDPRIVGSHRSDRLRQRRGRLQVRGGRSGSDRHGRADSTHGGDCRHAGGQTGSRHDALFSGSGLTGQASWDARSRGPRCLKRSMSQTTLPVTDLNDRVPAERSFSVGEREDHLHVVEGSPAVAETSPSATAAAVSPRRLRSRLRQRALADRPTAWAVANGPTRVRTRLDNPDPAPGG